MIGDFLVVDVANSDCAFDLSLSLKEDYDFTAQHLHTHGVICRVNRLFMTAEHYTNAGGAVAVRTKRRERKNINILRNDKYSLFRYYAPELPSILCYC